MDYWCPRGWVLSMDVIGAHEGVDSTLDSTSNDWGSVSSAGHFSIPCYLSPTTSDGSWRDEKCQIMIVIICWIRAEASQELVSLLACQGVSSESRRPFDITTQKTTIHQVTAMLATSINVLFPGHNHHANHQYWWPDTLIIARASTLPDMITIIEPLHLCI